jgi:CDP-glucose 4,6-dehydratase
MTVAFEQTFRGRDVFVTGHTGFKGSWLTLWLSRLGARVHGYALAPNTVPSLFEAARVRDALTMHTEADVRNADAIELALRSSRADFVFHLAAQPIVRRSYRFPAETFDINVMGTVRLLDAVRRIGRPCALVVVTSDKCYDVVDASWRYRESDCLGGSDPYSASKGAAELVVGAYRRSFFPRERPVRIASARGGNVIGGGDWSEDRIVPDIVRALTQRRAVRVRNPDAVRPWQHVLDLLGGYLLLASRLDVGYCCTAWNFGPDKEGSVRDLVDSFLRVWGDGTWVAEAEAEPVAESQALLLDSSKARAALGWRPRWTREEAIERCARWYAAYRDEPTNARELCMQEIESYSRETGCD